MIRYFLLIIFSIICLTFHLNANPLVPCVEGGDYNAVARLIRGGADVNGTGSWTPLALAAMKGHKDIVKLLLENGADPNYKGRACDIPLIACTRGLGNWYSQGRFDDYAVIAQCLIDAGADVNGANRRGDVALDWAVHYKGGPVVDVLLKNGANINFTGDLVDTDTRVYLEKRQKELLAEQEKRDDEKAPEPTPTDENASRDRETNFNIFDLGTLSSNESATYCINDNGVIVGSYLYHGKKTFFTWSFSGGIIILDLPKTAVPTKINNKGQIVGNYTNKKNSRGFLWDPKKGFVDLGTLGGKNTWVTDLNNLGQIVGQSETRIKSSIGKNKKEKHAFVWRQSENPKKQGKMKDLGTLPGELGYRGDDSIANAINDKGEIVGSSNTVILKKGKKARGLKQAVIWKKSKPEKMLFEFAQGESECLSINNKGIAAVLKHKSLCLINLKNHKEIVCPIKNIAKICLNDQGVLLINGNIYCESDFLSDIPFYSTVRCKEVLKRKNPSKVWKSLDAYVGINNNGEIAGMGKTKNGNIHAIVLSRSS